MMVRNLAVTRLQYAGCTVQNGELVNVMLWKIMSVENKNSMRCPRVNGSSPARAISHHDCPCPSIVPFSPTIATSVLHGRSDVTMQFEPQHDMVSASTSPSPPSTTFLFSRLAQVWARLRHAIRNSVRNPHKIQKNTITKHHTHTPNRTRGIGSKQEQWNQKKRKQG